MAAAHLATGLELEERLQRLVEQVKKVRAAVDKFLPPKDIDETTQADAYRMAREASETLGRAETELLAARLRVGYSTAWVDNARHGYPRR